MRVRGKISEPFWGGRKCANHPVAHIIKSGFRHVNKLLPRKQYPGRNRGGLSGRSGIKYAACRLDVSQLVSGGVHAQSF